MWTWASAARRRSDAPGRRPPAWGRRVMPTRHDGLTLAVGLTLTAIGVLLVLDGVAGMRVPGLWYSPPEGWEWLQWRQSPLFGLACLVAGLVELTYWAGWRLPLSVRVVMQWAAWVLLLNLTVLRAMGFWTPLNPPWFATVALGALTIAVTVRRVSELRAPG